MEAAEAEEEAVPDLHREIRAATDVKEEDEEAKAQAHLPPQDAAEIIAGDAQQAVAIADLLAGARATTLRAGTTMVPTATRTTA